MPKSTADYDDVTLSIEDILSKGRGISIHFTTNNDEQIDATYWNIENKSVVQTFGSSKDYHTVIFTCFFRKTTRTF